MIGLVSLLVIGPEKLPKAARITGFWLGKTRRMVATVKAEIKGELREEELRQLLSGMQTKINTITKKTDSQARSNHFIDTTKKQMDKEKHGGK